MHVIQSKIHIIMVRESIKNHIVGIPTMWYDIFVQNKLSWQNDLNSASNALTKHTL